MTGSHCDRSLAGKSTEVFLAALAKTDIPIENKLYNRTRMNAFYTTSHAWRMYTTPLFEHMPPSVHNLWLGVLRTREASPEPCRHHFRNGLWLKVLL